MSTETKKKGLSLGPLRKGYVRLSGDSIFYTIQGEGPSIGTPVLFLRTHECNLKCSWCDAWYTWNKDTPEYWNEPEDVPFIYLARIMRDKMYEHKCARWVLTGGEPLMQKIQLENTMNLLNILSAPQMVHWEIETNGTIKPTEWMMEGSKKGYIQFNVSPKLLNSNNPSHQILKADVLSYFAESPNSWFKFVVTREEDVDEIIARTLVTSIPASRIILMPEGTTPERLADTQPICEKICKERGWRLTPRLQIQLYGDQRAT